jgi:cell division protein FtsX
MKRINNPFLFLFTAIAGTIIAAIIIGFSLYQYVNFMSLVQESQQSGLALTSAISNEGTGYIVATVGAIPLAALSLWLMYKSVKILRTSYKRGRR